jgi:hypothetical protein
MMQKILGFLLVIAVIAGIVYYFSPKSPPNLTTVVAKLEQGRVESAAIATSLKRGTNDPNLLNDGRYRYEAARARFNGCVKALEVGLITGWGNNSAADFQANLKDAAQKYAELVEFHRRISVSAQSNEKAVDFFDWVNKTFMPQYQDALKKLYEDFQKKNELEKIQIEALIKSLYWQSFDELR